MSGKLLARASAIILALMLTACGGDSSSTPLAGPSDGSNSGTPGDGSELPDDSEQLVVLELGTGSGANFQSGQMTTSADMLSSGGSTRLDFNVVNAADGNSIYNTSDTSVTISSLCEASVFDTPLTTASGSFSTSYEAGCAGGDTITARLPNGSSATANVTVAAPEIGELEFVSVSPDSIALSGSSNSSRPSVSEVSFRLADTSGNPITTGADITFELSTTVGGVALSQTATESNEMGIATTRVNAGTVATVVSVTATFTPESGPVIQTTSAPISISATIPDQDSFSISVAENFLPNARNYDGVSVPITIRAADRNNNRTSDAVVNFITNSGSVQSECILQDGACTIDWHSQNPRAADGVVLILARTVGEESFRDVNSDGQYTVGTDFFTLAINDLGEAFLDRNQNGVYDQGEEYFDYNDNGRYDSGNGMYNGSACIDEVGCSQSLLEIRQTAKLFLASDIIRITLTDIDESGQICAEVAGMFDIQGAEYAGPPPGGTSISFSTTNGDIVAPASFISTMSYRTTPVEHCVILEGLTTGTLTVEVTPPAPYGGAPITLQESISAP